VALSRIQPSMVQHPYTGRAVALGGQPVTMVNLAAGHLLPGAMGCAETRLLRGLA
jgi:hypothetical protein